jgi:hypothetical protein
LAHLHNPTTMSRLAREFQRLYGPHVPPAPPAPVHGGVRALVLEVARPAQWQPLAAVWQGLQADLGLPAPAIAANGTDGLQLWLSLAEAVDNTQGLALLERLRQRYMADVPLHRVAMSAAAAPPPTPCAVQPAGPWSAFVAADLAPVFEESPWLDLPPNEEGQADLLQRLASIQPAALAAAWAQLLPRPETPAVAPAPASSPAAAPAANTAHPQAAQFLLSLMQDTSAPLALRVEAAKALLPYGARG